MRKSLTPTELLSWKAPIQKSIISENLLVNQGTMGIYGAESVAKSILVNDIMFKVSMGLDWLGFKTTPTTTLYLQTEMPQAMLQERERKYMLNGPMFSDNCYLWSELYLKVDKGSGKTELDNELRNTNPNLLIVDPLNTSVFANLNDEYDSGIAIDTFNMVRKEHKCAVVIVHHSRKMEHVEGQTFRYGTAEWGGSGRWVKWLDTIIFVELVNDGDPLIDLRLTFEKTKHSHNKINPIEVQVNRLDLSVKRKVVGI
jgi:RecA-family ATPase